MKLGKGKVKDKAVAAPAQAPAKKLPGRPLWVYGLPLVAGAAIVLALLTLLGQQQIWSAQRATAEQGMRQAAQVLAGQVAGIVDNSYDLLALLAADPAVLPALRQDDTARRTVAGRLQQGVPQWLQLRLLPADWDRTDPQGPAPMGFAGVDMVRRAATGRRPPAEVHQLEGDQPYLALAEPLLADGTPVGVLFAALPLKLVTAPLDAQTELAGDAWLSQRVNGGSVALGVASAAAAAADGSARVSGTILEVAYRAEPIGIDGGMLAFLGLAALGVVALVLLGILLWRRLAADLRADMGAAVTLGEAILNHTGGSAAPPRLRATADTLLLLTQYAQRARSGRPPAAPVPAASQAWAAAQTAAAGAEVAVEELDEDDASLAEVAGQGPRALLPDSVFRAYDIRGLAGEELRPDNARLLGQAVGTLVQERGGSSLAVARDARLSSPELAAALIEGIVASGADVVDLGTAPTPMMYFARFALETGGGVVVTGSHNPPEYNGFKIQVGDDMLAEQDLAALRERMADGPLARGRGVSQARDLSGDYLERVVGDVALARPLRLVIDAGNGVAGPLAVRLFEALGCEVIPLYCEPDGNFPHHHPDPSQPDNLAQLADAVRANGSDLGIAFDGDGDRVGLIDEAGNPVWPDQLLMLLAADVLIRHPGADILYDVKGSRHLAGFILSNGGRPVMWRSGHTRMKAKLRETGALLAGEFAGHYYIKERWYGFDDGLYAAARLLEILSADPRPASEVFAELPVSPATPEYHLPLEEGQSVTLMQAMAQHVDFPGANIVDLDGLRIEFADGWGLVRPSNTTPALVFRFEAQDETALERIKEEFRQLLSAVDAGLPAPF
jgi:phosphomannomutase/phosphoglucomutase